MGSRKSAQTLPRYSCTLPPRSFWGHLPEYRIMDTLTDTDTGEGFVFRSSAQHRCDELNRLEME